MAAYLSTSKSAEKRKEMVAEPDLEAAMPKDADSETSALLPRKQHGLADQVGNYLAAGSTVPQIVGSKLPPAANQLFHTAKNGLTSQFDTKVGPFKGTPGSTIGDAGKPDGEESTDSVDDRVNHFLVAYPRAHDGDVEDFTFSGQLKDMSIYMRDLRRIAVEREASSDLLEDITRVNQFYSDLYDLALGSAGIHRSMKRVKEQYNLVPEERDAAACAADLQCIVAQLPAKHAASQFLYEELGKYENRAHQRDSTVQHTLMMTIIRIPLAIHQVLNSFMTLRNTLRGIFLATSFSASMIGVFNSQLSEQAALFGNLFNFIVFMDMLFTHGGESILLSMVGTPDLEQRYEELVVELREKLELHAAATKKIVEATKLEIQNQVLDDDWNLQHMYGAYLANWALDSQTFKNPLHSELGL